MEELKKLDQVGRSVKNEPKGGSPLQAAMFEKKQDESSESEDKYESEMEEEERKEADR